MFRATLTVRTHAREEFVDVTAQVRAALGLSGVSEGMLTLFVPHTTAAITINENADPAVPADMLAWLRRLIPVDPSFRHAEGNSDAHLKASLVGPSVQVPIAGGQLLLGTWQALYFCEFDGPRERKLEVIAQ